MHPSGLPLQILINDFFDLFRVKDYRLKKLFCVSPAQTGDVWNGLATSISMQKFREGAVYPQQQDERYIPFASKLKDSVQKFSEPAIAPLVKIDLYPERSL